LSNRDPDPYRYVNPTTFYIFLILYLIVCILSS